MNDKTTKKGKKRLGNIEELLMEHLSQEEQVQVRPDNINYDESVKEFLDDCELRNLAYHTRRWHNENLRHVKTALTKLGLTIDLALLTDKDFKKCILHWKREVKNAPTTINHRIRSLTQLYRFLIDEGVLDYNPIEEVVKLKAPKTIIKPFDEDDLKKLLRQPDKRTFAGFRDYTIMLTLLDTGIRLIELENMKVQDVNLKNNALIVFGKGAKEREVIFQNTTKEYLRRYLKLRGILDHEYVWISVEGDPLKRRSLQGRLSRYGKSAGITDKRVSCHTFRHTFAKMYITNGGDTISLQKLLGHSSLDMVRHYVNLWGTDVRNMHRKYSPVEHLFRGF